MDVAIFIDFSFFLLNIALDKSCIFVPRQGGLHTKKKYERERTREKEKKGERENEREREREGEKEREKEKE